MQRGAGAARVARAAEDAGFESLWTAEHVVLPDPQAPPSPSPPETPILDPAVALAFLAAHTTRIRLGTGIIILPQRNPLVLAKELASVDVVSSGRLIFGLGVGYLKPEFDALGVPFTHKGARALDYLQAMLALWTQAEPSYEGRFVRFRGVQAFPRPVQKPHPPIVIGGHTPEAFRRAVAYGSGWYGFALDVDGAQRCIAGLEQAAREHGRPGGLAGFEISVTPSGRLDLDTARRFADLGVSRLIPLQARGGVDEQLRLVSRLAEDVLGRV
ncbi:MAG: LLM class F420-dependent oxidoreductase [Thermodesulfobacteriota bacterium]